MQHLSFEVIMHDNDMCVSDLAYEHGPIPRGGKRSGRSGSSSPRTNDFFDYPKLSAVYSATPAILRPSWHTLHVHDEHPRLQDNGFCCY